jgi:hypothetical protein
MPGSPTDREGLAPVAVAASDYLWFVDLALDGMAAIHCLGVLEYWGGATVAEHPVQRDRAAEFTASGEVAGLLRRTDVARRRLREDIVGLDAADRPANVRWDPEDPVPYTGTKGAVLLHILEELFQHLDQMELTRDALVAAQRR